MIDFASLPHRFSPKFTFGRSLRVIRMSVLMTSLIAVAAVCVSKGGDVEIVQNVTPVTDDLTVTMDATRADIEIFHGDPGNVITQLEAGNRLKVVHRVRPGSAMPTSNLLIETFIPSKYAPRASAIVRVWVPEGTELNVTGDDVSIEIKGPLTENILINGEINLSNGDATLTDVSGDFIINTGSGGITLNRVTGEYQAETARGSIFLRGAPTVSKVSHLETGAGSIFVDISSVPDLPISAIAARGAILLHDDNEPLSGSDISIVPQDRTPSLELVTANGIIDIQR